MKNHKYFLIAGAVLMFAACANDSGGGESVNSKTFPENSTYYTLPEDCERIDFPSSYAGKKAYVIYSNESGISQMNTLDGINNSIERTVEEENLNSIPEIKIIKNAIDMGNGLIRSEVYFDYPDLKMQNNFRAVTSGQTNYYNDHNSSYLPNSTETNPQYLKFWVTPTSNKTNFTQQSFNLKATGNHCRIWVINSITENLTNYNTLANVIDSSFEKITAICGSNAYNGGVYEITATNTTKLEVLIYDIFGDAANGDTLGYQRPYDFYQNSFVSTQSYPTNSNECEVIHIDSYFLKNHTDETKLTLLHEFQHLLNTCNKNSSLQRWFTEMLSMSVEEIFQYQFDPYFQNDNITPKSRFYQTFDKPYIGFLNFDPESPNVLYYYANTYAFGAYLMRNYGGIRLIHEIATNPYVNATAITEALHTLGYSNENFDTVLKKFGMVYINTNNSNYSLYNDLNENFNNVNYKLKSIDLNKYYFRTYNSQYELQLDWNTNLYFAENSAGANQERTIWVTFGPRIYKPSYIMLEPIQAYGFAVYYIGDIKSGGTSFKVKHKSPLTMTVVVK